jgi:hypothetical protein
MPTRRFASLIRVGSAFALVLVASGCTAGGQFDPTEVLSSDILNTKKKLAGEREPLFPNGVPGAETGVPPDLVKGYQPPPEQAAENTDTAVKPAVAAEKPKPKPKPKPKVAHVAPLPPHDAAWDQKSASPPPSAPSPWLGPSAQPAQTNWPAAPSTQPAQTNWPAPPSSGQIPQAAQPAQPAWPNPPAPSSH